MTWLQKQNSVVTAWALTYETRCFPFGNDTIRASTPFSSHTHSAILTNCPDRSVTLHWKHRLHVWSVFPSPFGPWLPGHGLRWTRRWIHQSSTDPGLWRLGRGMHVDWLSFSWFAFNCVAFLWKAQLRESCISPNLIYALRQCNRSWEVCRAGAFPVASRVRHACPHLVCVSGPCAGTEWRPWWRVLWWVLTYGRVSAQKQPRFWGWRTALHCNQGRVAENCRYPWLWGERIQNSTCSAPDCPETQPAGVVPLGSQHHHPPAHLPQPHPSSSSSFLQNPFRACDLQLVGGTRFDLILLCVS